MVWGADAELVWEVRSASSEGDDMWRIGSVILIGLERWRDVCFALCR